MIEVLCSKCRYNNNVQEGRESAKWYCTRSGKNLKFRSGDDYEWTGQAETSTVDGGKACGFEKAKEG